MAERRGPSPHDPARKLRHRRRRCAYHDTDATNDGGAYRLTEGVDIEPTGDSGGGYDVGWTHGGEWMKYTVNVATAGIVQL